MLSISDDIFQVDYPSGRSHKILNFLAKIGVPGRKVDYMQATFDNFSASVTDPLAVT